MIASIFFLKKVYMRDIINKHAGKQKGENKLPLDAIALGAVTSELEDILRDARAEKIHQPERDELLIIFKTRTGQKKLVISAGGENARIHLADSVKENPQSPPMFCMLLRKHLTGARLEKIERIGCDRVVDILFAGRNEMGDVTSRHLICEIMGRSSNIILLDENMKIMDAVKHIDLTVSSVRNILPGMTYMLPPQSDRINPLTAKRDDFIEMLKTLPQGKKLDRVIAGRVMGISPLLAGECVFRACNMRDVCAGEMTQKQTEETANNLYALFEKARKNEFAPCILQEEQSGKVLDFAPFEILQYGKTVKVRKTESMNEAVCEFYFLRDINSRMQSRSSALKKQLTNKLQRAQKKLDILQNELKSAAKREELRICGELITANLFKIKKGDKILKAQNFYDENYAEKEITLDVKKTPSQNAAWYFTRYKKAKNTEIYASEQIASTVKEIEYLESVLYSVSEARTPSELAEVRSELVQSGYIRETAGRKEKKKVQSPKPMEFEYDGYTIYIGRNNIQNDFLTMKIGRSRDLWLHTKNIPGAHTLIKYKGEDIPNNVIERAAQFAAYYSKGKNAPYVEVDYCPISHVKKPNGAKAGMVIYEGYSTALVKPLNPDKE